jgi:hypothetical protein
MATTFETGTTVFSFKQRAVSLTLGIACTVPLTSTVAMGYVPAPQSLPVVPNGSTNNWHNAAASNAPHTTALTSGVSSFAALSSSAPTTLVHTLSAPTHTHNYLANIQNAAAANGTLNLASSKLSFLAGNLGNFQSLTINVGGKQEVVNLNTKLTAAEVVAVQQVLTGAGQTIKIGANGAASGGQIVLNNNLLTAIDSSIGGSLSSLTVARGVQVVDNLSSFSLSGSLTNYGSILTAAGTAGATDTISAGSVLNARSASIGSYTTSGALYGADLSLNAANSVTNNGSISSANILNISAPAVYNISAPGANASLSAGGNVNINTTALTNSGTVSSANGNVNVASTGALTLNGAGGTLQALNGNVNLHSTNADINVNNGNILSQQVNYTAGSGDVNATMDEVTGVVNTSGNNVHVAAYTENLTLGTTDANDPMFVNGAGNVNVGSLAAVAGQPYTIIASGNIFSGAGSADINTSGAPGGPVNLIAGAVVTGGGASNAVVTKASATGGMIDLTGTNVNNSGSTIATAINTSGTGASAGGSVQLIAYAGKNVGSGSVYTSTINTSSANNAGGAVTIIAGAKTGTAVQTGDINASGKTAGGTITVDASTPTITVTTKGVAGVVFAPNGDQTTNAFAPSKTFNTGSIILGDVNTTGPLNINTGASAKVSNTSSPLNINNVVVGKTGSFTASDSAAAITLTGTITGGTSTLTATGANTITATAPGASINTTTFNLNAGDSTANVDTNVANLVFTSTGGDVTVSQNNAKGTPLALNLSGQEKSGLGSLTVNSPAQINISGLTQISGKAITINASSKGGIAVNNLLSAASGTIDLNISGTGKLTQTKGNSVTGNVVNINSTTSFGSKTAPFVTAELGIGATLSVIDGNAKNTSYVSDTSVGTLTFIANPLTLGGSLFLTSTAPTLNVSGTNYTNVSLTDTSTAGSAFGIVINGPVGNAAGAFTATSATNITGSGLITGKTVVFNAANFIGLGMGPLNVSTPTLTFTSTNGQAIIQDNLAVVVNGSVSLNSANGIQLLDTAAGDAKTGASITVGKSLTGGNIQLTTSGAGGILATGTIGNSASNIVQLSSNTFVTTKGAINGATIGITANGGALTVGGAVGALGSAVTLTTTSATPALNTVNVNGVVSGKSIVINSAGQVITTKAISGLDAGSSVKVSAIGTPTTNAITVGAAISGDNIVLGSNQNGNVAINANVGLLASSSNVQILAGIGGTPNTGAITGKGVISGQLVDLESDTAIGTSKAPVNTIANALIINNTVLGNDSAAFIAQKGNLSLGSVNSSALTMKVTGALVTVPSATITSPQLNLTVTGNTSLLGGILDGGTPGAISITSGAGLTADSGSKIASSLGTTVTLKVTGPTNLNGTITGDILNVTSSGLLTLNTTSNIHNTTDNLSSGTSGIILAGALGNGADTLNVTTTGALQIGFPNQTALVNGTGTLTGATITNYGSTSGNITFNATGAGTTTVPAFANYGTIGATTNVDSIIINASKGSIVTSPSGLIDAATLILTAGGNAAINLGGSGTTNVNTATVKGAFVVGVGSGTGVINFGSTPVGSITAGSVNLTYADANTANNGTLNIGSVATKTGDLTVSSNARNLNVVGNATLTTLAGNINLQNTNTNAAAKILLGTGVTLHASGAKANLAQGNVSIFMGPSGYVAAPGVTPPGVVPSGTTPAQVTFGSTTNNLGSITVGTGDVLNSTGRNLSFNTNTLPSTAIVLSNNVSITADPPVDAVPTINLQNAVIAPAAAAVAAPIATTALTNINAVLTPVFNPSVVTATVNNQSLTPGFLSSNATIDTSEAILDGVGTGIFGANKVTNIVKDGVKAPLTGSVSNAGHITLDRGPLLLSPEQDTVVETPFGNVNVSANSMALIIASANGLSVYNLHDAHKNAVVVSNGSNTVSLIPGRSAVFASTSVKSFEEANQVPFVPYRRVTGKELENGKIYQAEFDLTTMVRGLPALKKLVGSTDAKQRASAGNVLKTAAILMQLSASGEPYALYLTPSLTACALSPDRNHN